MRRGEREGPAVGCDRMEATEDVRESAVGEGRRVSGKGESSSSLYGRRCQRQGQHRRAQNVHVPITPP